MLYLLHILFFGMLFSCGEDDKDSVIFEEVVPEVLIVSPSVIYAQVGDFGIQLITRIMPENYTIGEIVFRSNDTSIATVSLLKGVVEFKKEGNTTILVRITKDVFEVVSINVTLADIPVDSIRLSEGYTIVLEDSVQLNLQIFPEEATINTVTWFSPNTNIVRVDTNGVIIGVSIGTVTILAQIGSFLDSMEVEVVSKPIPLQLITLNPNNFHRQLEDPDEEIIVNFIPLNHTAGSITWMSSNSEIVRIQDYSENSVTVSFVGIGNTSIVGSIGGKIAVVTFFITPIFADSIRIFGSSTVNENDTIILTTSIFPQNVSDQSVKWSSLDSNIAKVSLEGVVTGITAGITSIYVQLGNKVDTFNVSIQAPATSIDLGHSLITKMLSDPAFSLIPVVLPGNYTNGPIIWESNDTNIVIVFKGTLTFKGTGLVTIKASIGEISETIVVNVSSIPVDSFTITGASVLRIGDNTSLIIEIFPNNATDQEVLWMANNPLIASINEEGIVTGKKIGVAFFIATVKGLAKVHSITVQ